MKIMRTEHFIDVQSDNGLTSLCSIVKGFGDIEAGDLVLVYHFEDVNGWHRPSFTKWRDGRCIKSTCLN